MKTEVLILGGGLAGVSTAFHLGRSLSGSILLVEREKELGQHASGRNAGQLLQASEIGELRRLLVASRKAYQDYRDELGFRQVGSLLLGSRVQLEGLADAELEGEFLDPAEVLRRVPLLDGHAFETALWTPTDGVLDRSRLLRFYTEGARSRGVSFRHPCEVREITRRHGVFRVESSAGPIESRCLINAAGAWAPQVALMAGASPIPLRAFKRHLFLLTDFPAVPSQSPFVWSLGPEFYFRPEGEDLLFCICDEKGSPDLDPGIDPEVAEDLSELIWHELPALREAVQQSAWACFRTHTPDSLPVLGWDSRLEGFFWVAGLGGHGLGSSWEIGRLAARAFRKEETTPFDPGRFRMARDGVF